MTNFRFICAFLLRYLKLLIIHIFIAHTLGPNKTVNTHHPFCICCFFTTTPLSINFYFILFIKNCTRFYPRAFPFNIIKYFSTILDIFLQYTLYLKFLKFFTIYICSIISKPKIKAFLLILHCVLIAVYFYNDKNCIT
jgi:hypothetical protein